MSHSETAVVKDDRQVTNQSEGRHRSRGHAGRLDPSRPFAAHVELV